MKIAKAKLIGRSRYVDVSGSGKDRSYYHFVYQSPIVIGYATIQFCEFGEEREDMKVDSYYSIDYYMNGAYPRFNSVVRIDEN